MKKVVINNGKTQVTICADHNLTVTEKNIIIDLVTTSSKTKKRGRPLGSTKKKTTILK